jgi:hypothetical protein
MGEADGAKSFVGRKNVYDCPTCRHFIVTVHRDHGVTPMFLRCRATPSCGAMMVSRMYQGVDEAMPAFWEWYRPSKRELRWLNGPTRDHVKRGGLLIRALEVAK